MKKLIFIFKTLKLFNKADIEKDNKMTKNNI